MLIQTDASKITQEELDHLHRMTKIARVGRINACARSRKAREHVRILREALERVNRECDLTPHEDPHLCYAYDSVTAETVIAVRAAIEATKGDV